MKRTILSLAFLCLTSPAWAVDLSVDLSTKILTADGQQKKECTEADTANPAKCANTRDLTVGIIAMEALSAADQTIKGDAAAKNGALAIKLATAKDKVELSLDEIQAIKSQVGKFFDPVTVSRVWSVLEPKKDAPAQ